MLDGVIYRFARQHMDHNRHLPSARFLPPACRCHTTPALPQRGFVHVVTPINNHVTKANKDDFSPKRIKSVNRRVNKSGYAVYLTSTLVLINVMYSIAMERNRKLNVLGYSLIS